ncbi:MAG: hypothetical protein JKY37_05285 [Nannocystaceae bacterium]|nr:hypothetical protein [Nannocystaceae bacterium]
MSDETVPAAADLVDDAAKLPAANSVGGDPMVVLGRVNDPDLQTAPPLVERKASLALLRGSANTRPLIDEGLNAVLDLMQASADEAPCGLFGRALATLETEMSEATHGRLVEANVAVPNRAPPESETACDGHQARLVALVGIAPEAPTPRSSAKASRRGKGRSGNRSSRPPAADPAPSTNPTPSTKPSAADKPKAVRKLDEDLRPFGKDAGPG